MINTLLFGINILLAMVIWKKMLRPSLLDRCRDQLFDLRDEVRSYFVDRSISLDTPIYHELRDLLNFHLRFTENMTLSTVIAFSAMLRADNDLNEKLEKEIARKFMTDDPALRKFVEDVRGRAVATLMSYMIFSSAFWLPTAVLLGIAYTCYFVARRLYARASLNLDLLGSLLANGLSFVGRKTIRRDALEEMSYRSSGGMKLA